VALPSTIPVSPGGPFLSCHAAGRARPFGAARMVSERSCLSLLVLRKDLRGFYLLVPWSLRLSRTWRHLPKASERHGVAQRSSDRSLFRLIPGRFVCLSARWLPCRTDAWCWMSTRALLRVNLLCWRYWRWWIPQQSTATATKCSPS